MNFFEGLDKEAQYLVVIPNREPMEAQNLSELRTLVKSLFDKGINELKIYRFDSYMSRNTWMS